MTVELPADIGITRPMWGVLVVFGVLALFPFVLPAWLFGTLEMNLFVRIFILALFATSANLLFGYSGLLTLGHAAFYGMGAYVLVLTLEGTIPVGGGYFTAVIVSLFFVTVLAAVMGIVCVQKGEFHFALLTLAFSMLLFQIAREWKSVTRGGDGLIFPNVAIELGIVSFGVRDTLPYYLFTLVVVTACLVALWYVTKTPLGELFLAVRENPERARFVGVRVTRVRWLSFIIGGVFGGVAGILIAPVNFVVSPQMFHWLVSADPLLVILIGGPYTFVGPLVGAAVFAGLEHTLSGFTQFWRIALGALLVPIVIYLPGGIAGYFADRRPNVHDYLERFR